MVIAAAVLVLEVKVVKVEIAEEKKKRKILDRDPGSIDSPGRGK